MVPLQLRRACLLVALLVAVSVGTVALGYRPLSPGLLAAIPIFAFLGIALAVVIIRCLLWRFDQRAFWAGFFLFGCGYVLLILAGKFRTYEEVLLDLGVVLRRPLGSSSLLIGIMAAADICLSLVSAVSGGMLGWLTSKVIAEVSAHTGRLQFSLRAMLIAIAFCAVALGLPLPMNVLAAVCVATSMAGMAVGSILAVEPARRRMLWTVSAGATGGFLFAPLWVAFEWSSAHPWPESDLLYVPLAIVRCALLGAVTGYWLWAAIDLAAGRGQPHGRREPASGCGALTTSPGNTAELVEDSSPTRLPSARLLTIAVALSAVLVLLWWPAWSWWREHMAVSKLSHALLEGRIEAVPSLLARVREFRGGADAVGVLAYYAKCGHDNRVRVSALEALRSLGDVARQNAVVPAVLKELQTDPSERVRAEATKFLRAIAEGAAGQGAATTPAPLPEFITGDECLFCHRFETGKNWQENRHNRTIRPAKLEPAIRDAMKLQPSLAPLADQVEFVMGDRNHLRLLKKGAGYGKLELLSAELIPPQLDMLGKWLHAEEPEWNAAKFGESCAGCHTTQLDSRTKSFATVSLDCYVCHGAASLDHSKDTSQITLAKARNDSPNAIVSICGQCHLRGGRSNATGLPFPNNFVAGGELFRDFLVDFETADDPELNPADRHVYQNVRDVIERSETEVTCLSCHSVHRQSTISHRRVPESELCLTCHNETGPKAKRRPYEVHSAVCGY